MSTEENTTTPADIRAGLVSDYARNLPADLLPGDREEILRVVLGEGGDDTARAALSAAVPILDGPYPDGGTYPRPGSALSLVAGLTEDADEKAGEIADNLNRRAYHGSVRCIVEEIEDEARTRLRDGEDADTVREWADETIHERADGSWWVIYTHANFRALFASDNWEAASDEGLVSEIPDGGISALFPILTYAALVADIREGVADVDTMAEEIEEGRETAADDVRDHLGPAIRDDEEEAVSDLLADRKDEDAAGLLLSRLSETGPGVEAVRTLLGLVEDEEPETRSRLVEARRVRVETAVSTLSREEVVRLLSAVSIDTTDEEDVSDLRTAVAENVLDGTIPEADLDLDREGWPK